MDSQWPDSRAEEAQLDGDHSGDELRIVPESELSEEIVNRIPAQELEERRLRAIRR